MQISKEAEKDIEILIDSILSNTTVDYVSGHSTGTSDTYECSQCGASVRCRDVKNAKLTDLEHEEDCAYSVANRLYSSLN